MKADVATSEQVEVMNSLAFLYRTSGYARRALILLLAAQAIDPDNHDVQINLAYTWFLNSEHKQALAVLRRCMDDRNDIEHSDPIHLLHSRILWALGLKDDARTVFRDFISARRVVRRASEPA